MVHNSTNCTEISLMTNMGAIAMWTKFPEHTLAGIYVPPNKNPTLKEIEDLLKQLPPPYLVVGDFNARNTSWVSKQSNQRGKILEKSFEHLVLANDDISTYLGTSSGNCSYIDLAFCNPTITTNYSFEVLPFPSIISMSNSHIYRGTKPTTAPKTNKKTWK